MLRGRRNTSIVQWVRRLSRGFETAGRGLALVGLLLAASCVNEQFTEVVVLIDLQPEIEAATQSLHVRVWNHERTQLVFDRTIAAAPLPREIPLFPLGNASERSYLMEVTAFDGDGGFLTVARLDGTYLAGQSVRALLCLEDGCHGIRCGASEDCANTPGSCTTCSGSDSSCQPARPNYAPAGASLECPPPDCVRTADREVDCSDEIDDDCNGDVDCSDAACNGSACGSEPNFICAEGNCECALTEICNDGRSNDCDDLVDCEDPDCFGEVCDEESGLRCNGDTLTCATCATGTVEICDNGIDDDCNNFVDCEDPFCCGESRCDGQRCRNADNFRCCAGACVRIDVSVRCGACGLPCPRNPGTGARRACSIHLADEAIEDTVYLCWCAAGECQRDMTCERNFDRPRCNCQANTDCGPNSECVKTGRNRDNYCRPLPL